MRMESPKDNDIALLKQLEKNGISFSKVHTIEFNVDFKSWPPQADVIAILKKKYHNVKLYEPDENFDGYLTLTMRGKLSYEFVKQAQSEISTLVGQYGAYCNSWAVLFNQDKK